MSGRILSLQRQARELGRLRSGYTDGRRPVRSETWILTSHAEHYVQAAADTWGGSVETWQPLGSGAQQWRVITQTSSIDALLPPGDPLSQQYELWSGGGCARRCDSITESISDRPCLCLAEHGDQWNAQPRGSVCSATTRLNVFLPDMPDVGVFRMETHSFYAASEIAGAVDLIKSAVGPESVIPIRLRIEQRQRKANGQTKKFPVVVVELRGITTGQVLEGSVMGALAPQPREAIETSRPRAIEPAPVTLDVESVRAAIHTAGSLDDLRAMWSEVKSAGLEAEAMEVVKAFQDAEKGEPDGDQLWSQIMQSVPEDWTSSRVEKEFHDFTGVLAEDADPPQLSVFLTHIRAAS